MFRKSVFMLLVVALSIGVAKADNTLEIKRKTDRAVSLIERGRYSDARHSLTLLRAQVPIDEEVLLRHIDFELARCAFELKDNSAEQTLLAFLRRYPESVHANDAQFMLAMYYCEKNEHSKALACLNEVSYEALTSENKERYNMRLGYIEFVSGEYDKAYERFSKL